MTNLQKILVIHNTHAEKGGEDTVVSQEVELLQRRGHEVELLEVSNEDIPFASMADRIAAGFATVWSREGYRLVEDAIARSKPDLAHVHNTFNRLSPSIFWALSRRGVPAVATLHNYRFVCAQGGFMRDNAGCYLCLTGTPLWGLRYRCYHGGSGASAAIVAMQYTHEKILRTFHKRVQGYIIPSRRGIELFASAGWDTEKLYYKPHFIEDPLSACLHEAPVRSDTILFVGRLSIEKGFMDLLDAWGSMPAGWQLEVIGTGPLEHELAAACSTHANIHWRGWCDRQEVMQRIQKARFMIIPSLWQEPFGMAAIEALACGTPILASSRGGLTDIVEHEHTGLLFEPGQDGIRKILQQVVRQETAHWSQWSRQSREAYLARYRPESNYVRMIQIYQAALSRHKTNRGATSTH